MAEGPEPEPEPQCLLELLYVAFWVGAGLLHLIAAGQTHHLVGMLAEERQPELCRKGGGRWSWRKNLRKRLVDGNLQAGGCESEAVGRTEVAWLP